MPKRNAFQNGNRRRKHAVSSAAPQSSTASVPSTTFRTIRTTPFMESRLSACARIIRFFNPIRRRSTI